MENDEQKSFYEEMLDMAHDRWNKECQIMYDIMMKHLNPTNMNENKGFTQPGQVSEEAPGPFLNEESLGTEVLGPVPTEKLPVVADVLEEGIPAPDNASVIKHLFDELYEQVLNIRGAGPWEAEFRHAAAVAQTF